MSDMSVITQVNVQGRRKLMWREIDGSSSLTLPDVCVSPKKFSPGPVAGVQIVLAQWEAISHVHINKLLGAFNSLPFGSPALKPPDV